MSSYSGTPELHHVFNELDRHGLLLNLPRLEGEDNASYKQRLFDVMVHRADSSYLGLIYGVTRELGFELIDTLRIDVLKDGNGDPLVTHPAIVFLETKCYLYSDFAEGTLVASLDRFETNGDAWSLGDLVTQINNTGYYSATILNDLDPELRSMTIFNQRSFHIVPSEVISGSGIIIKLDHRSVVNNSVVISSNNLTNRVDAQVDMVNRGDFYIDHPNGIIYCARAPAPGDTVRYEYTDDEFIVQSSPVIIHNLQSEDFKTKMFEQVTDGEGDAVNGLPTVLGADIINELLSVYPTSWGK